MAPGSKNVSKGRTSSKDRRDRREPREDSRGDRDGRAKDRRDRREEARADRDSRSGSLDERRRSSTDGEAGPTLQTPLRDIPYFSFNGRFFEHLRVAKVYDGDSVTVVAPIGLKNDPARLVTRLKGVDACEIRGEDREHGMAARRTLVEALRIPLDENDSYDEAFFDEQPVYVDIMCHGHDKYGRELVEIAPCGGQPVNAKLCESEHFASYDGTGPRPMKHD